MSAELLYFAIYLLQQLGVMLGVGAQTLLLCAHLIALHRGEAESAATPYARAARIALGVGLIIIFVSGAAAIGIHYAAGEFQVLLAPAFIFKWVLAAVLAVALVVHSRFFTHGDLFYAFVGGSWYALFLVHSLAPVATWTELALLYAGWMVVYALIWFGFVGLMRLHAPKKASVVTKSAEPSRVPQQAISYITEKTITPVPALVSPPPVRPAPVVAILTPPAPPPAAPPLPPEPPVAPQNLPILAPEHGLTVSKKLTPPPNPPPSVEEKKPEPPLQQVQNKLQDIVDHLLMPALRIMPQRPEDIATEKRGPLVK